MADKRTMASAAELEAILAVIPDIYFRVDAEDIIRTYAAGRNSRLYVAPELFLDRRVDEVLPRDTAALLTDGLQRARKHHLAVRIAYTLPMPAGETPFVADLYPLDSGDVVVVVRDESATQAAARTREEIEHLRQIVPSAVFTVDRQRRITSWNRRAAEITGFTAAEMLGQPCTLFAEHPCRDACGLFDDALPKPVYGRQCRIRARDGRERQISKNVDVLRDAQGRVCGGIESFEDITDLFATREQVAALQRETDAILAAHYGRITIDSSPESGTAVTVMLPATAVESAVAAPAAPLSAAAARPLRLLLVDDEEAIIHSVGGWLRERGHRADCVPDGDSAAALLAETEYDLLILDCNIPGTTSPELARRARARTPTVGIIVISGALDAGTVEQQYRACGGVKLLPKPFDLNEFARQTGVSDR